jgi:hypothetical protein
MKAKNKSFVLVSFVLCLFFVAAVSCSTSNPPVDAKTGATIITPKK